MYVHFSSLNWHSAFGHFLSGYWCNYRIEFPLISRRVVFLFFQFHDFLLNMFFWVSFAYQDSSMCIPAQQFLSLRALGAPAVGIRSSPFEIKWRVSISWPKLNITDLTVYRLPCHLKFQMTRQSIYR